MKALHNEGFISYVLWSVDLGHVICQEYVDLFLHRLNDYFKSISNIFLLSNSCRETVDIKHIFF